MPRLRRFGSAKTETDLRETNWQAGQHDLAELGWETALFHQLASRTLGQRRRRQRAVPPQLCLGRQGAKARVRSRFHRAETRPASSHAFWLEKYRPSPHRRVLAIAPVNFLCSSRLWPASASCAVAL